MPIGLSSSGLKRNITTTLNQHRLETHFRFLATADDGLDSKPPPGMYLRALSRFQNASLPDLKDAQCVVIEDSPRGTVAAKRAYIRCTADRHTCVDEQLSRADRIASGIGELLDDRTDESLDQLAGRSSEVALRSYEGLSSCVLRRTMRITGRRQLNANFSFAEPSYASIESARRGSRFWSLLGLTACHSTLSPHSKSCRSSHSFECNS